jgi:RNA polymerase sigma-70 factor, ECF subfamily
MPLCEVREPGDWFKENGNFFELGQVLDIFPEYRGSVNVTTSSRICAFHWRCRDSVIRTNGSMAPAPNDIRTDEQLVEAINGGDSGAFEVLYFRHRDWVMRLALRFTGHHDDALDVLQETFAYLVRKFPGFRLTASITTFLYPAVKNLSIAMRKKRLRSTGGDEQLPLMMEPQATNAQDRNSITELIAGLSDAHREILLMRYVDDMTQPEIASALDIPLGTAKSRLHHAIIAIRERTTHLE